MPRRHDDESPTYQLPPDPTDALDLQVPAPLPGPFQATTDGPSESAQTDGMTQLSNADSTSQPATSPRTRAVGSCGGTPSAAGSTALPSTAPSSDAALRQLAYTLYCRGLRSDTIAAQLGVPARTVRHWLHRTRKFLLTVASDEYISELLRAIESQRAVIAAAWTAYEREHRLEDEILAGQHDYLRRRILHYSPDDPPSDAQSFALPSRCGAGAEGEVIQGVRAISEEYVRPLRYNTGARYLAVIIAAQREISRLEDLYSEIADQPPAQHEIIITRRPDGPENVPPEERPIRFPHLYPSTPGSNGDAPNNEPHHKPDKDPLNEAYECRQSREFLP